MEKNKKTDVTDFEVARPGDGLLDLFQCNTCIFRRLLRKDPNMNSASEKSLLMYIRRTNAQIINCSRCSYSIIAPIRSIWHYFINLTKNAIIAMLLFYSTYVVLIA